MNDQPYSAYWNWLGDFTKGPQPCGCGKLKSEDCPDREIHIEKAIKAMQKIPDKERFLTFWKDGKLV